MQRGLASGATSWKTLFENVTNITVLSDIFRFIAQRHSVLLLMIPMSYEGHIIILEVFWSCVVSSRNHIIKKKNTQWISESSLCNIISQVKDAVLLHWEAAKHRLCLSTQPLPLMWLLQNLMTQTVTQCRRHVAPPSSLSPPGCCLRSLTPVCPTRFN